MFGGMSHLNDTHKEKGRNKMTDEKRLEVTLDAIEEFELEWYEKHPEGSYTETHYNEYRAAKREFVEEYLEDYERELSYAHEQFIEDYYNDPEVQYGWYQQDLIDMRRRER